MQTWPGMAEMGDFVGAGVLEGGLGGVCGEVFIIYSVHAHQNPACPPVVPP